MFRAMKNKTDHLKYLKILKKNPKIIANYL